MVLCSFSRRSGICRTTRFGGAEDWCQVMFDLTIYWQCRGSTWVGLLSSSVVFFVLVPGPGFRNGNRRSVTLGLELWGVPFNSCSASCRSEMYPCQPTRQSQILSKLSEMLGFDYGWDWLKFGPSWCGVDQWVAYHFFRMESIRDAN